jgi:hypothetical protein
MVAPTSSPPAAFLLAQELLQPLSGQLQIALGRFPSPFLEGMNHVDGLGELVHIDHPILTGRVDGDSWTPSPIVGIGFQSFGSSPY